jgi:hypothetical protein
MSFHGGQPLMLLFGFLLAVGGGILAYMVLGGLGVALLGLGTLFIAIRTDLERDAPVGGDRNENLFALTVASQQRAGPDDRPAKLTDHSSFTRLNIWAQIFGATTLMVGIALWRWEP